MRRLRSSGTRVGRLSAAAIGILVIGWMLVSGCEQGQGPYNVLPPDGAPDDYLPPGGVAPGITHRLGLLYRFDQRVYKLFPPYPGTDPRFVFRDSVLATRFVAENVERSANDPALLRPDLLDATLRRVYNDPRLFGFKSVLDRVDTWEEGEVVPGATAFLPLALQGGDYWEYNHNGEWTDTTYVVGTDVAPTARGEVYRLRHKVLLTNETIRFKRWYNPDEYRYDVLLGSVPGQGLFAHGWSLVADRPVICLNARGDIVACPRGTPAVQRNPSFLWVNRDALAPIDQCLDLLPGFLEMFPVQLAGDAAQVGDIFSTWTYLKVDRAVLRQRLREDSQVNPVSSRRCGIELPVERDTLRAFPTGTFNLLCLFESRVERVYDRLELKRGRDTIGRYGTFNDGQQDVIKLVVRMIVMGRTMQFHEIYLARGFGEVVRTTGERFETRSLQRLRSARLNGQDYPYTFFSYVD